MANPALKNGYISIATELVEKLATISIPSTEMRLVWVVWRKTWGWKEGDRKKDWDWIALSQFEKLTTIKRAGVAKGLKSLVVKRLLLKSDNGYKFNQNYEQWSVVKRLPPEITIKYKWSRKCAFCDFSGILERHHIIPKHEGGTNDYDNLIVLCPNHHAMADRGQISKEDLKKMRLKSSEELGGSSQTKRSSSQTTTEIGSQTTTHNRYKDTNTIDTNSEVPSQDIVEIINSFKPVNPAYQKWFGNKTQRGAIQRMIPIHGKEKILQIVSYLPRSNTIPYVPIIVTPLQLEEKWSTLQSALLKKKSELQTKVTKII